MIATPCCVIRGGTSKGLYFLASDLPLQREARDTFLLKAMGSPDPRQIDGMGGAHPLTSKVAIVSPSTHPLADVDYLFLQVMVEQAVVSDSQNCGNILAGVGPFAIETGLVAANEGETDVRVHMVNTGALATVKVNTTQSKPCYRGNTAIDGVPGTAAPILINFHDVAGSSCGALFPTGNTTDVFQGITVTCIDNGMPIVMIDAESLGLKGDESPPTLEAMSHVKARIEAIRLEAGKAMNLGDVSNKTVPKMTLVSSPKHGGVINTRSFIPHRVHDAIGVLASVSVATACAVSGTVAATYAPPTNHLGVITVEHPTGQFDIAMEVSGAAAIDTLQITRSALVRTARLLMRGEIYVD